MPALPGIEIEHEFLELPAGRFHVARAGDRSLPAVMLVHGFPQNWWCWRGVIERLAGEAHLIMPDLRGTGWSDVPVRREAYRKTNLAEDLNGILGALGIDQIAVAAHDWGAYTSQLLAIDHPDRISKLLLLSIPSVIPTPRPPLRTMARMKYQLQLSAPGSAWFLARYPELMAKSMRQDAKNRDVFTSDDAWAFAAPYRDSARARGAQAMYRSFVLGDLSAITKRMRGKKFQMPVRFVLSATDAYIPPQFVKGIERTGDRAEGVIQDRTGHFVVDEDPGYVADQVREWLLPAAVPVG